MNVIDLFKSELYKEAEQNYDDWAKEEKEKTKRQGKAIGGAGLIGGGVSLAKRQLDRGNLTGRELLFHDTNKANLESILASGFESSRASDKKNLSNMILGKRVPESELAGKTYFGRNKRVTRGIRSAAINVDRYRDLIGDLPKGVDPRARTLIKARVPSWQMKIVDNPELLGAKSGLDFFDRLEKAAPEAKGQIPPSGIKRKILANKYMNILGPKGTRVIQGDVGPQYIKGSKHYQRAKLEEVKRFIKANPKRFAAGVVGAGAGLSGAAIGAKLLVDSLRNKKKKGQEE